MARWVKSLTPSRQETGKWVSWGLNPALPSARCVLHIHTHTGPTAQKREERGPPQPLPREPRPPGTRAQTALGRGCSWAGAAEAPVGHLAGRGPAVCPPEPLPPLTTPVLCSFCRRARATWLTW